MSIITLIIKRVYYQGTQQVLYCVFLESVIFVYSFVALLEQYGTDTKRTIHDKSGLFVLQNFKEKIVKKPRDYQDLTGLDLNF
jgi:hypothetical protein